MYVEKNTDSYVCGYTWCHYVHSILYYCIVHIMYIVHRVHSSTEGLSVQYVRPCRVVKSASESFHKTDHRSYNVKYRV